jgi:hypothetical protein
MTVIYRFAPRPGFAWRVSGYVARVRAWLRLWAEIWHEAQDNARKAHERYPFSE